MVEIYEAQEEYFAQPPGNRRRFRFTCSAPTCRTLDNPPLVVGVNYDKDAEESEIYQQPHFKSHHNHPHTEGCLWVAGEAARHGEDSAEEQDIRHPRPKATNVIDVFEPRGADILLSAAAADVRLPTGIRDILVPPEGEQAGEHLGFTTTSHLEKLVDCWSQLEPEERRRHRITIEGRTLSYHQVCLHITSLNENENGTRVVYGGAHAKPWPADDPTHFFVNFIDDCARFEDASGDRSLTISLPIKRLKQSRRGGLLINRIEQSVQPEHYLRVYAWGDIAPRTRGKGCQLNLAALDNLVLKAIHKKPVGHSDA